MINPSLRIVVPVHGAIPQTARCLRSLLAHTDSDVPIELIDDASPCIPAEALKEFAATDTRLQLTRFEHNLGFGALAQLSLESADEDLILLLNSDTLVTPGWLKPLIELMGAKPKAALITPLSNEASFHSLPLPEGWGPNALARALREIPCEAFDLVTAAGFCMLLRREMVLVAGGFDAAFGRGYGEESDLSMRLRSAGLEVLGCPQSYVWHEGKASFGSKLSALERPGHALFMARWQKDYERDLADYRARAPLADLRERFPAPPRQRCGAGIGRLARALKDRGVRYTLAEGSRRALLSLRASLISRGAISTLKVALISAKEQSRRTLAIPSRRSFPEPDGRPRVLFLLEELGRAGGVSFVLRAAEGLQNRGFQVFVAAPSDAPQSADLHGFPLAPIGHRSDASLAAELPPVDLVVATLWSTAARAAKLVEAGRAQQAVYLVQGDERVLYREAEVRRRVEESFGLIATLHATTPWLAGLLAKQGHPASAVVFPGIDRLRFRPPFAAPGGPLRIIAMARPNSLARGFPRLQELAARLAGRSDVQLVLFGDLDAGQSCPGAEIHGFLTPSELAQLYRSASIFIDPSPLQAFGLPALEAMASGCALIVPDQGGVGLFARDGETALQIDMGSGEALLAAVECLVADAALRQRLRKAGLVEAWGFDIERSCDHLAELYRALIRPKPLR